MLFFPVNFLIQELKNFNLRNSIKTVIEKITAQSMAFRMDDCKAPHLHDGQNLILRTNAIPEWILKHLSHLGQYSKEPSFSQEQEEQCAGLPVMRSSCSGLHTGTCFSSASHP